MCARDLCELMPFIWQCLSASCSGGWMTLGLVARRNCSRIRADKRRAHARTLYWLRSHRNRRWIQLCEEKMRVARTRDDAADESRCERTFHMSTAARKADERRRGEFNAPLITETKPRQEKKKNPLRYEIVRLA